jgi:DDE superfamily endonuclease
MAATDARRGGPGPRRSIAWGARASRPSSKWPGRRTPKSPEAIPTFQATCHDQLQRAIPPDHRRPLRVCSQDESRFGLLTVRRRRLPARGVQPRGPVPHVFEWVDVYGAVEPMTGDRGFLELPSLNAARLQLCIDAFAEAFPSTLNALLLDNRGAHAAERLLLPAHVCLVCLPPDGPALNPIERVWRALKDALAWLQCTNLEAQQADSGDLLRASQASTLQSLTRYAYWVEAIHALCA